MAEQSLSQATFYQYRLLKKINLSRTMLSFYLLLPCAAVASEMLLLSWDSFFFFLLAFMLVLWIHFVIGRSVLHLSGSHYTKKWRFSLQTPWVGYMPEQYVNRQRFRQVQWHTLWIGTALLGVMAFWSPVSFTVSIFFWHLWLIAPRYFFLLRFAGQPQDGMLRFGSQDVSYYSQ
ncbi:hypothetical protein [Paenibacillus lemnae]|uniref:Uncharacterized protein n=1 Tax=Paenibacillus lemnae TaxID=1330551 RepID=A0A848MC38_PAELE|nr:hypothetical protein [Paenibacillus lemnae]NMO98275.1 hypothetical protein [Paenibacillus lemnae]